MATMKQTIPFKRNFGPQNPTPQSPLYQLFPAKPTHLINILNTSPTDHNSGHTSNLPPPSSPSSSPSLSPSSPSQSQSSTLSKPTVYNSLKQNIKSYYNSIQNYFSNRMNVDYETDDYYEYERLHQQNTVNTYVNNQINSVNYNNTDQQFQQQQQNQNQYQFQQQYQHSPSQPPPTYQQHIQNQIQLQSQPIQQSFLTTVTSNISTPATTKSTLINHTSNNFNIIENQTTTTTMTTTTTVQSMSTESSHFIKNAINLPSPCFKSYDAGCSKNIDINQAKPPTIELSRLNTFFNNICFYILRDSNINPQDWHKARLCIGFCFTIASFIPSWIVFFYLSDLQKPAHMAVVSLPMTASSLWALRKTGSTFYPGHMLCFTLCFALSLNAYYTGGHQSTIRLLMSTLPIVSALIIGRRASVQWSFAVLMILLGFFVANITGYEYLDGIPSIKVRSHMNFIIDVTLVLITMSFTLCYQYFIDEANKEMQKKNQELTIAKDAAVEAYQARQEFLATMSHEIRTPLNGLIGMATLLRDSDAMPPEEKQMAKSVKSCGDILLRLVNDILDLSKLEANQMVIENIGFRAKDMAHEICQVLDGQAKEHNLGLHYEVSPNLPYILYGDTGRILQVLMNLTGNAIKFTPAGAVKIIIDLIDEDSQKISFKSDEYNVCFRVQDTGIGVPPESHQKIFEAFVQADPSDSRKYGGSGLGLYLCAKLVKLMRGEIGVFNNANGGSTFWFILPLKAGNNNTNQSIQSVIDSAKIYTNEIRVLIAEDNFINQRVAAKFLEKLGIRAEVVSNGNEVLSILERETYDLIFMDFQMPVLDGLRCASTIRQMEKSNVWPNRLPIFICGLTANTMSTDKKRCYDNGMNWFISKPFQITELQTAIEMTIEFRKKCQILCQRQNQQFLNNK